MQAVSEDTSPSRGKDAAGKRTRRWSKVYAFPAFVVGAGVGFFVATAATSRAAERFPRLLSVQLDHARVVFCHAPPEQSLPVVEEYVNWSVSTEDHLSRHGVELLSEQAILQERTESPRADASWEKAERTCRAAGNAACGREALRSLAEAACAAR